MKKEKMKEVLEMKCTSYESCAFMRIESYFIELRFNKAPP